MIIGTSPKGSAAEEGFREAWAWTIAHFPFDGYIDQDRKESYVGLAYTAWEALSGKGRVLDFGCGPLDKTAILAKLGVEIVAVDDFGDAWHREGENLTKIRNFASAAGIDLRVLTENGTELDDIDGKFDLITLHHVLEHLKDSPRSLLNLLVEKLKPGGLLYCTVPNAVNLRKRIAVLKGQTNYTKYSSYFWAQDGYRGHIREYVARDCVELVSNLGLKIVSSGHYNHFWHAVPRHLRLGVRMLCFLVPSFCDSCSFIAVKPDDWVPKNELAGAELYEALDSSVPFDYGEVLGGG